MSAWRGLILAALVGVAGSVSLGMAGLTILPFDAPSACGSQPCQATGAIVFLPNADRIDLEMRGPGPGIGYAPAGSPSNVVAR